MGKNKGITLIALVVTIIVLLILAGVSILMLTGENSGLSKARWAEFVAEYGNLDEVKNVFALEQQTIENYDIKINKKFILKSLFSNKSYAVDIDGVKTYYPVKGSRIDATKETKTLQRTIKYEENLNDEELSSEKVKLYEVDLSLLPSIGKTKRKYVINILNGNLYSIEQVRYEGLIYHTPRYGIREEEKQDDGLEEMVTIQYLSGVDSTTYTQNVPISQSSTVTLDALSVMNITNPGYKFVHWKDVTDGNTQNGGESEEIVEENTSTFEKKTGGYFEVVNELKEILGEDWEEDIIDIIEQNKEDMEQTENESLAETARQQTINSIQFYLTDSSEIENEINDLISNTSKADITNGSIVELAEWFISETDGEKNINYITELQQYEEENISEEESEDNTETPSTTQTQGVWYIDQATNVDMQGRKEMKLEAEWAETIVTLDGNGGTVNGQAVDVIGVTAGNPYGANLADAVMEKTGYGFAGWYTDSVNGTKVEDTDIYIENNLNNNTLYAHWQNSNIVTVTYDAGNGGVLKDTKTRTKTVTKTTSDKLGKLPIVIVEGVEFTTEWYDAEIGGNKVNKNTPVTSNMTIYCQWSKVELHTNGGTLTRRPDKGNNRYNTATHIEKFNKWNPVRNGAVYVADGKRINKQQDIKYNQLPPSKGAGWNRYIEKQEIIIGTVEGEIKKLVPKFLGWYTLQDKKVSYNSVWKNEYGTDLYAKWKEQYAIIYDANGGSWKNKNGEKRQQIKTVYENLKYPTIGTKPTKEGYSFVGWFDDKGTEIKLGNSNYLVDKNVTLYAHWVDIEFEVEVPEDNITNTGWTQKLKVTPTNGLSGYGITYYIQGIGPSDRSTYTQEVGKNVGVVTTTEKTELNKYKVWAEATNGNITIKSKNYIEITTGHRHIGEAEAGTGCYKDNGTCTKTKGTIVWWENTGGWIGYKGKLYCMRCKDSVNVDGSWKTTNLPILNQVCLECYASIRHQHTSVRATLCNSCYNEGKEDEFTILDSEGNQKTVKARKTVNGFVYNQYGGADDVKLNVVHKVVYNPVCGFNEKGSSKSIYF